MLPQGIGLAEESQFHRRRYSAAYLSYRLAMLHLLIHAQFGYLIHPSIKLPSPKASEEPLRIADVGTGTGYVQQTLVFVTYATRSTC